MHEVAPGASVVWYSGSSRLNKRAAILAYLLVEGSYWPWYLGWEMQREWKIVNVGNVSIEEITEIRKGDAPLDSSESEAAIR